MGIILIIALLVIPAATALNCSRRLPRVMLMATLCGAFSGAIGAWCSALVKLPTGALIVLIAAVLFG